MKTLFQCYAQGGCELKKAPGGTQDLMMDRKAFGGLYPEVFDKHQQGVGRVLAGPGQEAFTEKVHPGTVRAGSEGKPGRS